jgi:hypothetical protein
VHFRAPCGRGGASGLRACSTCCIREMPCRTSGPAGQCMGNTCLSCSSAHSWAVYKPYLAWHSTRVWWHAPSRGRARCSARKRQPAGACPLGALLTGALLAEDPIHGADEAALPGVLPTAVLMVRHPGTVDRTGRALLHIP